MPASTNTLARGENDPLVRKRELTLPSEASGGRSAAVPHAGHLLPPNQPDALHRLVEEFMFLSPT